MSRLNLIPIVALIVACDDGGSDIPDFTTDIQVDGFNEEEDPDGDAFESYGTRMCVTTEGHVYVLWLDNRRQPTEDRVDIWMNRSLSRGEAGSWLPTPVRVNQGNEEAPGPGNVWSPDLFCNAKGVYVVWEDDRDGELRNHQIYFNRSTDFGETFLEEDVLLEFDVEGNTMSLEPRIDGNEEDDLAVVWYDSANGAYDIFVATSSDLGSSWRESIRIDSDVPPGNAYSARPKVEMSRDGNEIWVVWEDSRDGKADIYFTRSATAGVTFEPDQRLDEGSDLDGQDEDGEHDSFEPQLCSDGVSNLYVVWHDSRNDVDRRDIYYRYSLDGGDSWPGNSAQLDSDGAGAANSLYPDCGTDGNEAHVVWQDNRNGGYDVFYRRVIVGIPDGATEERADIGDPGLGNSLDAVLGFDRESGKVAVAWNDFREENAREEDNGYTDLYFQEYEDGRLAAGGEQDYRIDSYYSGLGYKLDLNFHVLGGQWYACWTDGRGITSNIYCQRRCLPSAAEQGGCDDLGVESIPAPRELIGL